MPPPPTHPLTLSTNYTPRPWPESQEEKKKKYIYIYLLANVNEVEKSGFLYKLINHLSVSRQDTMATV